MKFAFIHARTPKQVVKIHLNVFERLFLFAVEFVELVKLFFPLVPFIDQFSSLNCLFLGRYGHQVTSTDRSSGSSRRKSNACSRIGSCVVGKIPTQIGRKRSNWPTTRVLPILKSAIGSPTGAGSSKIQATIPSRKPGAISSRIITQAPKATWNSLAFARRIAFGVAMIRKVQDPLRTALPSDNTHPILAAIVITTTARDS